MERYFGSMLGFWSALISIGHWAREFWRWLTCNASDLRWSIWLKLPNSMLCIKFSWSPKTSKLIKPGKQARSSDESLPKITCISDQSGIVLDQVPIKSLAQVPSRHLPKWLKGIWLSDFSVLKSTFRGVSLYQVPFSHLRGGGGSYTEQCRNFTPE